MPRTVKEWIGATPDTPTPPRVRLRVFDRDGGRCQCGCGLKIVSGDKWQTDHRLALVNGGKNRESNLQVMLVAHHKDKTKTDIAKKAATYAMRMIHLGFRPTSKRPMPHGRNSPTKRKITGEVVRRS